MDPIQAYRTIGIPVDLNNETVTVEIPFTVGLLVAVEEAIIAGNGLMWFRTSRRDKSIREVFDTFCKPYLPPSIDLTKVQPTFTALFFSRVRDELKRSITECVNSMSATHE